MKIRIHSLAATVLCAALAVPALAAPEPPMPHRPVAPHAPQRWWDGAHGHAHYYPTPGWRVHNLPTRSSFVFWSGINYGYYDGVWYTPGAGGYVVVRPPIGIVVHDLPAFRTAVVVGGLTYLYANGAYYRERAEGGYEVVPPPVESAPTVSTKQFSYPRQGQSADQQSGDEYECHRWAVSQSGFDPTAAATGNASGETVKRNDYQRARTACMEGRGYTVR